MAFWWPFVQTKDPASSSRHSFAIVPADNVDLTDAANAANLALGSLRVREITIGTTAGVITYRSWDGRLCVTGALPIGRHAIQASQVYSTGTTAVGMTGHV